MRKLIKEFIPPILLKLLAKKPKYGWFGNYNTWKEAKENSIGYQANNILEKVKESLLKVKNDDKLFELDTVLYRMFDYPYNWQLLSIFLYISQLNNNQLNVLDFGGSLGSSYFQHRMMLSNLSKFNYTIVEQPHFVDTGKKIFEDKYLKFENNIESCLKKTKPHCILLSGVIQCIEEPVELINKILSYNFEFIIVDRTPFFIDKPERITIQKVPPRYHEATLPYRIYNKEKFVDHFHKKYSIFLETSAVEERIKVENCFAELRFIVFKLK